MVAESPRDPRKKAVSRWERYLLMNAKMFLGPTYLRAAFERQMMVSKAGERTSQRRRHEIGDTGRRLPQIYLSSGTAEFYQKGETIAVQAMPLKGSSRRLHQLGTLSSTGPFWAVWRERDRST